MSDFLDFLFSEAPWLKPVLAWGIGLLLACIILTPIAYFIVWPFLKRVREQLAATTARLAEWIKETREEREMRLDKEADEFLNDGGLWRLSLRAADQWASELRRVSRVLRCLRRPVNKASKTLHGANERVPDLIKALKDFRAAPLVPLPPLPSGEEMAESVGSHRRAWLTMTLTTLLLLAIMTVNTVMLSQILRDLGLIPAALTIFGVPMAYGAAFLMTLIEAGLGVVHSAKWRPGKFSLWPWVFLVFALGFAIVEGFFWSRIAPQGSVTLPFFDYQMPQQNILFILGFVLVGGLFGLGAAAHEAASEVLSGRHGDLLSRAIAKLGWRHDRYTNSVRESEQVVKDAAATAELLDGKIQGPAANAESVRESMEKLRVEVAERAKTPPDWATSNERELTRSEVYQLAQSGGMWLMLSLIGAVVLTMVGLVGFVASLDPRLRWALSAAQAVAFFGVGAMLCAGETVVRGAPGANDRKVVAAPQFSRLAAYLIGGALIVFYVVLAFTTIRGAEWMVNLILGLFLTAAGYMLSPLLNVVRLWLWRVWNAVVLIAQAVWLAIVHVLRFIVVVLENIAYLFAAPIDMLRNRGDRSGPPPQPPAAPGVDPAVEKRAEMKAGASRMGIQ